MSGEDYFAELAILTGMTRQEWMDFLAMTPEMQLVAVQGYRDMAWHRDPDVWPRVLAVIEAVAAVAGAITGVAGALAALRSI